MQAVQRGIATGHGPLEKALSDPVGLQERAHWTTLVGGEARKAGRGINLPPHKSER